MLPGRTGTWARLQLQPDDRPAEPAGLGLLGEPGPRLQLDGRLPGGRRRLPVRRASARTTSRSARPPGGTPGNRSCARNPATRRATASFPYPALTADVAAGDPFTPLLRAYAGDDLQIRTLTGAHLNPHNFTIAGDELADAALVRRLRLAQQPGDGDLRALRPDDPGAPGLFAAAPPTSSTSPAPPPSSRRAGTGGCCGPTTPGEADLPPLPQNSAPAPVGYPVCPQGAPQRSVLGDGADRASRSLGSGGLVYNDGSNNGGSEPYSGNDANAFLFFNADGPVLRCSNPANPASCGTLPITCTGGTCSNDRTRSCSYPSQCIEPMVLRAAAGDCIQVTLYNNIPARHDRRQQLAADPAPLRLQLHRHGRPRSAPRRSRTPRPRSASGRSSSPSTPRPAAASTSANPSQPRRRGPPDGGARPEGLLHLVRGKRRRQGDAGTSATSRSSSAPPTCWRRTS